MMTIAVLVLLSQNPVDATVAQVLTWPSHHVVAQRMGDALAGASLVLPCLTDDRTKDCWTRQGLRTGLLLGVNELVKRTVKRERPDGSDRKSFFSMHTALTCVSGLNSKRQVLGAVLCGAVGYLRIAGQKHWLTDVLVGAGTGVTFALVKR